MNNLIISIIVSIMCTSCTYSISMIHTEGTASDVIDQNQDPDPNINPTLSLPLM